MNNTPKDKKVMQSVDMLRAAVENQGKWIFFLTAEGADRGLSPDFAERAMTELGLYYARNLFHNCDSPQEIVDLLMNRSLQLGHEATIVDLDADGFDLRIGYCPMLNMWNQLTDDADRKSALCDIACSAYKGLMEEMGYRMEKKECLARGYAGCVLSFKRITD